MEVEVTVGKSVEKRGFGMTAKKKDEYPWMVRLLVDSVKSFGTTTVIVFVGLWAFIYFGLPEAARIANRYCDAVETSQRILVDTQKEISATQKAMIKNQESIVDTQRQLVAVVGEVSTAAKEIITVEKQSQETMVQVQNFMLGVQAEHKMQSEKLTAIEEKVSK